MLGGAAAAATFSMRPARAEPRPVRRIDVHHHPYPQAYLREVARKGRVIPGTADWSVDKALADMDAAGVKTAMLSIANPGVWFNDQDFTTGLARLCNNEMAALRDQHDCFGLLATLPLPDMDASLREAAYALDTLKADGIGLFTNYGGTWLGDRAFWPLFDELNRRKTVVYTHPTAAPCCGNLVAGVADNIVEYGADTTRAIASLVFSGANARWPDLRFIFSHAGGAMPFLIERFDVAVANPLVAKNVPHGMRAALAAYYYDTAQASNPIAMGALSQVTDASHILFGTDYPFRTSTEHVAGMAAAGLPPSTVTAIEESNALALFPRLRG
jgi:6-methylsalicylate decarboxylase